MSIVYSIRFLDDDEFVEFGDLVVGLLHDQMVGNTAPGSTPPERGCQITDVKMLRITDRFDIKTTAREARMMLALNYAMKCRQRASNPSRVFDVEFDDGRAMAVHYDSNWIARCVSTHKHDEDDA